jgi:hypothetical protein
MTTSISKHKFFFSQHVGFLNLKLVLGQKKKLKKFSLKVTIKKIESQCFERVSRITANKQFFKEWPYSLFLKHIPYFTH